jgi:Cu(I)/Ag(I) efflux system membrane fusion protein
MNKSIILIVAILLVAFFGFLAGRQTSSVGQQIATTTSNSDREVLYWVAPMDPNFRRDEPGKSPMGMDLKAVYADQVDERPGVVKIDPTVVSNLGVRTDLAQRSSLPRLVDTVGYVSYDEDTVHHIHTRVDGWIENLATTAKGDTVNKGQLLFELYSPTLVSAQEEFLAALRSGNVALRNASKERIAALGVTASEINRLEKERTIRQRIPVYATSDGVIAHLGVRHGMFVTPSSEVMSIARLDSVWVLAEVLGRQATWVEPGQEAVVTLDHLPGTTLRSTVDYIYPELDPVTRTLKVRLRFENADELLRPNMFARVLIHGRSTGDIVNVSRQAVIRGGSVDRVIVDLGGGYYESRAVSIGVESGDRIAIRSGIEVGERVVTSAQFLIDSESNIESALGRLEAGQ